MSRLPKILHQTAKTAVVSEKWRPLQAQLRALHPDWEYRLWTDQDNLALIRERRPDLEAVYLGLPRPIMRADLIRYVYMEQFGGLYLDTDYQVLKPFDLDAELVLPRESDEGQPVYLGNCVFASVPGHPYWTAALAALKADPPVADQTKEEEDIIQRTGPGFLTRVWQQGFQNDPSILIPPRSWFHPPVPQDDAALSAILANPDTFGIHWCFGSWRALTPWARLVHRVKRMLGACRT